MHLFFLTATSCHSMHLGLPTLRNWSWLLATSWGIRGDRPGTLSQLLLQQPTRTHWTSATSSIHYRHTCHYGRPLTPSVDLLALWCSFSCAPKAARRVYKQGLARWPRKASQGAPVSVPPSHGWPALEHVRRDREREGGRERGREEERDRGIGG